MNQRDAVRIAKVLDAASDVAAFARADRAAAALANAALQAQLWAVAMHALEGVDGRKKP